jgi:hypothetical protein
MRTGVSTEWLMVRDHKRSRLILFATLWSSQDSSPASRAVLPAPTRAASVARNDVDGHAYVLPALIFFWFASLGWGLWYISHAV